MNWFIFVRNFDKLSMAYAISTSEALKIIETHNAGTLPRDEWTHEAHLMVGLYVVLNYDKHAVLEMKKRVWNYNEAKGKGNNGTGYHHTLTVFWIWVIRNFILENNIIIFDEDALDKLLFDEELARRNLVEDYYDEVMLLLSRREYFLPDLKPMPNVDYFKIPPFIV